MKKEFGLGDDLKLKIERENTDIDLSKVAEVLNSRMIFLTTRSQLFRFFHKLIYFEPEEGKIKKRTAVCKLCDEQYITRTHIYFKCSKLYGIGRDFMKIMRIMDPHYSEEEVMHLSMVDPSMPQASWLIANTVTYISKNRDECNIPKYKAFLNTELQILKQSRYADQEAILSIEVFIDLIGSLMNWKVPFE